MTELLSRECVEAAPVACDQALIDAFRAQMAERAERKRVLQAGEVAAVSGDTVANELFSDDLEAEDEQDSTADPEASAESSGPAPDSGSGPVEVTVSYALWRVQELRALMKDAATAELDDYLLEELERISKYNRGLVEKKPEKKGG